VTELARKTLDIAATQIGVREHGRNRGPEIDGYCRDIGHDPEAADPWCAIFVSAMVKRAAESLGMPMPLRPTAGCWTLDENAPKSLHVAVPVAGCIFITNGHKHTGFVESVLADGSCATIEGNTNASGSPEGDGVYRRLRPRGELLVFIDLNRA
jgi:hypothetical protein